MLRNIMTQLIAWKTKSNRKPLLLTGVRQCGKTFIIQQFGEEQFEDTAYFNFEKDKTLASVFENDFKIDRIVDELGSIVLKRKIIPGKTLVIFDEIQECPQAVTSLKYFCEDMPQLHVIAAGSLLGVAVRKGSFSFPVGKVNRMTMFPMSFDEFVRADGGEALIEGISKYDLGETIPELYTVPLTRYLKLFYIIGGMPEVVKIWVETHSFESAFEKQDEILQDYADDFGKHSPADQLVRIRLIWQSIPAQLAKENNKFVFSHVKSGMRAKDLEDSLEWLVNAGLIYRVKLAEKPEIPLTSAENDTYFKIYLCDTGLLCRKSGVHYRTVLDGNENFINYKGALTENYVLTQLMASNINAWFWRSDAYAEVDFITDEEGTILPIEVKSADNTKAKSLHLFCKRYRPDHAVKTSLKNAGDSADGNTKVWNVPLYTLFRLKSYIRSWADVPKNY